MSKSLASADDLVMKLGLPLPEKPGEKDGVIVSWPDNIGHLTLDDLAEQMTWWTGWASFARYNLARVESDLSALESGEKLNMAKHIFRSEGDYETVTGAKAAYTQRPDVVKAESRVQELKAQKKILGALLGGYEKKYDTISREISRRESDLKEHKGDRFST